MADVSLDEYIAKKRTNFHRPNGPNQAPFITNPKMRPQTIVRTFDARNKLGSRTNVKVQDARQKLVQKTKFVDARVRIENKAAMKTPNRFTDARLKLQQKKVIQNPQNADACFKIQITQSSKFDARAKIVAKKGPRIQVSSTTNAGGASVFQAGGNLLKVVRTNQVAGNTPNVEVMNQIGESVGLIRTIQNQGVVQGDLQQQQQWQQQQQQQQWQQKQQQQQWLQKQQQQQWQQKQTWQQQQWQQQQQVTRGQVLMSGDNIHVISANTQMNSAGRPTQVNMARTFRQTNFRPQPVQQLLSSNSNVAMTRSISNDIYQQPVAVHPQSAGYNPTAQCVRQPPFQAWSDSPMDTPQYAEEMVTDYDEELVDVVYEEEVLEDESPADQWSADTDPDYMAPVSPQMTIQAPVRQREADPLPSADIISPIQGFRIIISNLQPIVSQDDIIELFGAIGPLKRARLLKAGIAEVVFVERQDALTATQRYHLRELDGQPMHVKMSSEVGVGRRKQATGVGYSTPRVAQRLSAPVHQRCTIQHITAPVAKRIQPPLAQQARQQRVTPRRVAPQRITPPGKIRLPVGARIKAPVSQKIKLSGMPRTKVVGERIKPPVGLSGQPAVSSRLKPAPTVTSSSAPLRLARPSSAPVDRKPVLTANTVDQGLVHRALFKTLSKDDLPSRPVKFTVKI